MSSVAPAYDTLTPPTEGSTITMQDGALQVPDDPIIPFIEGDDESESFDWQFYLTGHYPFSWHPPNGYPDFTEAWVSSSPKVMSWRLANWLVDYDWDIDDWRIDMTLRTPAQHRSASSRAVAGASTGANMSRAAAAPACS